MPTKSLIFLSKRGVTLSPLSTLGLSMSSSLTGYATVDPAKNANDNCLITGIFNYNGAKSTPPPLPSVKIIHSRKSVDYKGQLFIIKEPRFDGLGEPFDAFVTTGGIQELSMARDSVNHATVGLPELKAQRLPDSAAISAAEHSEYFGVMVNSETVGHIKLPGLLRINVTLSALIKVATSKMPWLLVLRRTKYKELFAQIVQQQEQEQPGKDDPSLDEDAPLEPRHRKHGGHYASFRARRHVGFRSDLPPSVLIFENAQKNNVFFAPPVFPDDRVDVVVGSYPSEFSVGTSSKFDQPPPVFPEDGDDDVVIDSHPFAFPISTSNKFGRQPKFTSRTGDVVRMDRPPPVFSVVASDDNSKNNLFPPLEFPDIIISPTTTSITTSASITTVAAFSTAPPTVSSTAAPTTAPTTPLKAAPTTAPISSPTAAPTSLPTAPPISPPTTAPIVAPTATSTVSSTAATPTTVTGVDSEHSTIPSFLGATSSMATVNFIQLHGGSSPSVASEKFSIQPNCTTVTESDGHKPGDSIPLPINTGGIVNFQDDDANETIVRYVPLMVQQQHLISTLCYNFIQNYNRQTVYEKLPVPMARMSIRTARKAPAAVRNKGRP